jgi:hypothetical protein
MFGSAEWLVMMALHSTKRGGCTGNASSSTDIVKMLGEGLFVRETKCRKSKDNVSCPPAKD